MERPDFSKIPAKPGVYFFRTTSRRGKILYIGKAANLRARIRSYFRASSNLDALKLKMIQEAELVTFDVTDSPIAALILEARLIKEKQPPYNVHLRDDKKYFSIGFTREDCSRIFITHQPHAPGEAADFIGPFTDGVAIKKTMKLLRKVFPYRTHNGFPRKCLQYDMQLCPVPPGIDPLSRSTVLECKRNIRALKSVLIGDANKLVARLEREMRKAARGSNFELAAQRRDEAKGLLRVMEHRNVLVDEMRHDITVDDIPATIRRLLPKKQMMGGRTPHHFRIEGYDIANLAEGLAATGSMVVFENGVPVSDKYKQFRIKTVKGANDVAMLREVLRRRSRNDWPLPDLIMVDGGKPQLNAVSDELKDWLLRIGDRAPLIVGLAKREEEVFVPGRAKPLKLKKSDPFLLLLMHVRDEAHRFARRYHHRLRDYRY